jgi:Neprosin
MNSTTMPNTTSRWAIVGIAVALVLSPLSTNRATAAANSCGGGWCYFFASMTVSDVQTKGVSARLSQTQPKVGAQDRYSGAQLSIASRNSRQAIVFGWWVSKSVFHDSKPHVIYNAVVDGTPTCLYTCGFVPSKSPHAGSPVPVGKLGTFTIKLGNNRWLLVYNGTVLGYYPTSVWKGNLNRSFAIGAGGVVASASPTTPHSQMGNGQLGTSSKSAKVVALKMIGTVGTPRFTYFSVDAPNKYKVGFFNTKCKSACSMNYGGPGF